MSSIIFGVSLFFLKSNIIYDSIYTFKKKVTQRDFTRLYFFHPGFVFMLDIPGKPVYLPFD